MRLRSSSCSARMAVRSSANRGPSGLPAWSSAARSSIWMALTDPARWSFRYVSSASSAMFSILLPLPLGQPLANRSGRGGQLAHDVGGGLFPEREPKPLPGEEGRPFPVLRERRPVELGAERALPRPGQRRAALFRHAVEEPIADPPRGPPG